MLGNLTDALSAYRASLAIRERLASNASWLRDLAVSHGNIGGVLAQQGKTAEALEEFTKGREIIARLKEQFPDNAVLAEHLAWFDGEIAKLTPPAQPAQAVQ